MKLKALLLASVTVFSTFASRAQPLILTPEISPDGSRLAFCYQGDIWTVQSGGGRADRLTVHEAYESNPRWNPDGGSLAFQSDRFGNNDLFLITPGESSAKRLTFHSADDELYDFTSDGQLIFNTRRLYAQVEHEDEIQRVSVKGGTPELFIESLGLSPVVSPDGTKVAFVRGVCRIEREAYRGPANLDLWLYDFETGDYTRLTDFDGNDHSPRWKDNETLLYLSSESGRYNIHELTLHGAKKLITDEAVFGINSFSVSRGGIIAYQNGDQVTTLRPGDSPQVVSIDVSGDSRFDELVSRTINNKMEEYALSPDGKYIAYIVRGEVFVRMSDKDFSRNVRITNSAARERSIGWLNNETLIFTSDQDGQYEIYTAFSTDQQERDVFKSLKIATKRLTETTEDESRLVMSPDLKRIAYLQNRGRLIVADISPTGMLTNSVVLQDGWDTPGDVAWSPDSRWLAYSLSDLEFNQEVFIHAADNSSAPVNVSMHPKQDYQPVWSPDGSKLGFLSSRNNGDSDIWFIYLKSEDWERNKLQRNWIQPDSDKKETDEEQKKETDVRRMTVTIDFDHIYDRLCQVTSFAGNESDFVFDKKGQYLYYTLGSAGRQDYKVERNLYKIKWDGSEFRQLAGEDMQPAQFKLSSDGKYIYLLAKEGELVRLKTSDDQKEKLATSSRIDIDYPGELNQIFEEGWRALDQGFYDPDFHGQNWQRLKEQYKPLALKASTREDFTYIYNLMLGQLNSSHMGFRGGESQKETQHQQTGLIGVSGRNTKTGFEVTAVLPHSPADRAESKLLIGDVITSVDQKPVTPVTNLYELLLDHTEAPVLLSIMRAGKQEEMVLWPERSLREELYDDWVDSRRKLVEEYSGGKLGYLHIQGMNWTSFERFERELMVAGYQKEGMVIDVRYNGGGWTTDYLMAVLTVRQHAYTVPRGASEDLQSDHLKFRPYYPFGERLPLASWTRPSIALCNEASYSNAEIFSHAYKTLGIGKLVGKPTFGAVISTGAYSLVDGSYVRMPYRAWYVKATDENMEHGPAVPDLVVEQPPAYKAKKVDPQLKAAVDELLKEL